MWRLWQLIDSAFPAGGFSHSGGVEAARTIGELQLEEFVRASVTQAGRAALPFVSAAWDAPERLSELDELCDVMLPLSVANRASRAQGRAWLATVSRTFAVAIERPRCAHLAPVFGACARELSVTREEAQRAFLFVHVRGLVSAAVRLNAIGPHAAQALQDRMADVCERTYERCRAIDVEDAAQTAPLIELFQQFHDRLYSRLFAS